METTRTQKCRTDPAGVVRIANAGPLFDGRSHRTGAPSSRANPLSPMGFCRFIRAMTSAAVATVRVPGTTANLGSGFDTLGLAVAFYNRARVQRRSDRRIEITSPIAEASRAGALAMLEEAAGAFFKKTRQARFGADIHLSGDVPIARGLGSSVTARLGCVAGLNALRPSADSRRPPWWATRPGRSASPCPPRPGS